MSKKKLKAKIRWAWNGMREFDLLFKNTITTDLTPYPGVVAGDLYTESEKSGNPCREYGQITSDARIQTKKAREFAPVTSDSTDTGLSPVIKNYKFGSKVNS